MKKSYLFLAATAILALASCSDNNYVGDQEENTGGGGPISFDLSTPAMTRAGGESAATALGNQFIVWGEKNEINTGETGANVSIAPGATGRDGHLVFQNYQVNWVANAHSTTSNSDGWEYVGYTHTSAYQSHIQTCANPTAEPPTLVNALTVAQTIKYWDNLANSYTFTAISAAKHLVSSNTDIENGYITIQKNTTGSTVYDKGYKITATANADLSTLYISDRVNLTTKNSPVTLTFRNVLSQIRVGIYEIIPGYAISSIKFYKTDGTTEYKYDNGTPDNASDDVSAFGAVCPNVKGTGANTFTVTYGNGTTYIANQPIVTPSASSSNDLILGTNTNTISTSSTLGTIATSPTWDTSGGAFTTVFPQINNSTNLTLTCDYTLYNSDSGETIEIKGKTAQVPAEYLKWKPNYKYTYLFKITDDDLNPITFDAVEIVAEDGQAEYITTVTQPSITTFGVVLDNSSAFKNYVTGKDEYQLPGGTDKLDIYATFMQGANVLTPQLTSNNKANFVTVYAVKYKDGATSAEKAEKPITEGSVAESIANPTGNLITATAIQTITNDYFGSAPGYVGNVLAEDGTTRTIHAVKLPGVKTAGKYAVEIVTYEEVTGLTAGTSDVSAYYTLNTSDNTYSAATGNAVDGTKYYKQVKTYKVITVEAAPVTP